MLLKIKKCSKCGEVKSINEFCKDKNRKDNYGLWCKNCRSMYLKNYRKKNINKIKIAKKDEYKKIINFINQYNK